MAQESTNGLSIDGIIARIYAEKADGWKMIEFKPDKSESRLDDYLDTKGMLCAVDNSKTMAVFEGRRTTLCGEISANDKFGPQLQITSCTQASGLELYLSSPQGCNISARIARAICEHFGDAALQVMTDAPARLTEVSGIGEKRAELYHKKICKKDPTTRDNAIELLSIGFSPSEAERLLDAYGKRAAEMVRKNPYQVFEKSNLEFSAVDAVARRGLGWAWNSAEFYEGLMVHALARALRNDKHAFLPMGELYSSALRELRGLSNRAKRSDQKSWEEQQRICMGEAVRSLAEKDVVVFVDQPNRPRGQRLTVYLKSQYLLERETAQMLWALHRAEASSAAPGTVAVPNAKLNEEQRQAVEQAMRCGVTVVTGGPGTGKTTVINTIARGLNDCDKTVMLCAPTGRAAKRMSEVTGREASTIHRLLGFNFEKNSFLKDENDPIEIDALIVDEMSMVDIALMHSLLRALKPGTKLILVGDPDQLPSVGPGNVLRDIIASGVLPVTHLTKVYRQGSGSGIAQNAQRINRGEEPVMRSYMSYRKDPQQSGEGEFFIERLNNPETDERFISDLIRKFIPEDLGIDSLRDIQVLSPRKKGNMGVAGLNALLQQKLNPPAGDKREYQRSENSPLFRLGDKVMHTHNNYRLEWSMDGKRGRGVFNGDIGYVTGIYANRRSADAEDDGAGDSDDFVLEVTFEDDRVANYTVEDVEDLELAYCVTVHKSQGGEFPAVVLALAGISEVQQTRELLYTAVTRARRQIVVLGETEVVAKMVSNENKEERNSTLADRLREEASGANQSV